MLIDGFIKAFNDNRASHMIVSDRLVCVDESFSRWYGMGGSYINIGLPCYISMDRKPEDGCEIWSCCDGRSGIMLQIMVVKSAEEKELQEKEDDIDLNHGTKVLMDLVKPWKNGNRIVCANSYFASVQCARELLKWRLKFIAVIKFSHKDYPMDFLSRRTLQRKGDWFGLVNKNEDQVPEYLAFVWLDRDRSYVIATTLSLAMGDQVVCDTLHQLVNDKETPPERTEVNFSQPRATHFYYGFAAKIDQHNRYHQATLGIERKLVTHNWAKQVNITILYMCLVDAWKV
jgi:Transposase IS4